MKSFFELLCHIAATPNSSVDDAKEVVLQWCTAFEILEPLLLRFLPSHPHHFIIYLPTDGEMNPAMYAAQANNLPLLKYFVEDLEIDVDYAPLDDPHRTALFLAANAGATKCVEFLIPRIESLKKVDSASRHISALSAATRRNDKESVKRLLTLCVPGEQSDSQEIVAEALFDSVEAHNIEIFNLLIDFCLRANYDGSRIFVQKAKGCNLLGWGFHKEADLLIIKKILQVCPNLALSKQGERERTPLDQAISGGNIGAVYLMTTMITDLGSRNRLLKNALVTTLNRHFLRRFVDDPRNLQIFSLLVRAGAPISQLLMNKIQDLLIAKHCPRCYCYFLHTLIAAKDEDRDLQMYLGTVTVPQPFIQHAFPKRLSTVEEIAEGEVDNIMVMVSVSDLTYEEQLDILERASRPASVFQEVDKSTLAEKATELKTQYKQASRRLLGLKNPGATFENHFLPISSKSVEPKKLIDRAYEQKKPSGKLRCVLMDILFEGLTTAVFKDLYEAFKTAINGRKNFSEKFGYLAYKYHCSGVNPWSLDINMLNEARESLLSTAVQLKKDEYVQFLLEQGADPNCKDLSHPPLLFRSLENLTIINHLAKHRVDVRVKDEKGKTPLMIVARSTNAPAVIARLVEIGVPLDERDPQKLTDPAGHDFQHLTAFDHALLADTEENAVQLFKLGAKLNDGSLRILLLRDKLELFIRFLDHFNELSSKGQPPFEVNSLFYWIVKSGAMKITNYFISTFKNEINFHELSTKGESLLHVSCEGPLAIFELFLLRRISFSVRNTSDDTVCDCLVRSVYNYLLNFDHEFFTSFENKKAAVREQFYSADPQYKQLTGSMRMIAFARWRSDTNNQIYYIVRRLCLLLIYEEHDNPVIFSETSQKYLEPLRHYISACTAKMVESLEEDQLEFAHKTLSKMKTAHSREYINPTPVFQLGKILDYHQGWGGFFLNRRLIREVWLNWRNMLKMIVWNIYLQGKDFLRLRSDMVVIRVKKETPARH